MEGRESRRRQWRDERVEGEREGRESRRRQWRDERVEGGREEGREETYLEAGIEVGLPERVGADVGDSLGLNPKRWAGKRGRERMVRWLMDTFNSSLPPSLIRKRGRRVTDG